MTDKIPFQKIYSYLCSLIAFFLPAYIHIVPVLIALLVVNWILEGDFKGKVTRLKSNFRGMLFISFYLLYIAGMLWTSNTDAGLFDLQVKLSLVLLPLIFITSKYFQEIKSLKNILTAFVYGCLTAVLICFSHAIYLWMIKHEDHFTYMNLSIFLHPSYLSMYLSFAIPILATFILSGKTVTGKIFTDTILIIFFWFSVIMLQSKAGILVTGILFISLYLHALISKTKTRWMTVLLLVSASLYFLTSKYIITYTYSRIRVAEHVITDSKVNITSKESNQVRILIWESSMEVIKNNLLYGVGTGDVKDALMKEYEKKGMTGAIDHHLNAHNQYIQTLIALGLPGISVLFSLFVVSAWHSIQYKKWILFYFLIITFLNFIPESMLEVQAGVIFYACFNSLLLFSENTSNDSIFTTQDNG